MSGRGLEKGLVIIDKPRFEPDITKIIQFGNGWIDVQMSDGYAYRRSEGTISWRYNNPGNLKFGPFAREHGAVGPGWGGHSVFPNYSVGSHAKKELLFSPRKKYHRLTITEALAYYAPAYDGNNPDKYANYISSKIGVPASTNLFKLTEEQRVAMLRFMEIYEGFKVGKVERI